MMQATVFLAAFLYFAMCGANIVQDRDYWYEMGRAAVLRRAGSRTGERFARAKNVVFLVADGLGVTTNTAARVYKGQKHGATGEEASLAWDNFPALAMTKTYNLDAQIGESSACATALLCGVKANFETVGLDVNGRFGNCASSLKSRVDSLIAWAQQEGKATGLVTNTRVTHATPAAAYAHSASRYWEDDAKIPPQSRRSCKDIARQLVEDEPGRNINVVFGGGRRHWMPKVANDPEQEKEEGRRLDGRNLIEDWLRDKKRRGIRAQYVWNKEQMDKVDPKSVDHILGLFAYSHMDFEADRDKSPKGDPSLAEMTKKALSILQKNSKGFFLLVESGRIDHAHHYNNPFRALDETLVLEEALLSVLESVDQSETLIVVTSDHSHVLTMGGLATPRGNPIFGTDTKVSDVDGLPYWTLLYGNGPGYTSPRAVPANLTGAEKNSVHSSAVPRQWATHGGEDVPVMAQGPLDTALFSGTMDQTVIAHAIAYAACYNNYTYRCNVNFTTPQVAKTQNCPPEENSVTKGKARGGRGGIVLASSVMSEDGSAPASASSGARLLTSAGALFLMLTAIT
ncbi:alkaline phosphatase-like [Cimex lectularius]|uniref:alkaline phosphatase n=1 Tax=Cimex lectularius TaxID=79782 RepID=A0A8I6RJU7_CIMLE|nr:alkaline phosphatase-like [Cimex lectularius]